MISKSCSYSFSSFFSSSFPVISHRACDAILLHPLLLSRSRLLILGSSEVLARLTTTWTRPNVSHTDTTLHRPKIVTIVSNSVAIRRQHLPLHQQSYKKLHSINSRNVTTTPHFGHPSRLSTMASSKSASGVPDGEVFIGSIDQGTTSTRFLIFNKAGQPIASHQIEFEQMYPHAG